MRDFEVLFDESEPGGLEDPASRPYGRLGFPAPPDGRPWIFSNFVQSLDGIASLLGQHASGSHLSQSVEDRWLMDLLRAHADAVILGVNTLTEETELSGGRGPEYAVEDAELQRLRERLGRGRERNIFVTGAAALDLSRFAVFDGDRVDAAIVTTRAGAERMRARRSHPHVRLVIAGEGALVDLPSAMRALREEFGIRYLLCEGGPTLNGYMERAGLIDEKFLTVSPVVVGQSVPAAQKDAQGQRPTTFNAPGFTRDSAPWYRWLSCRRVSDHQFNRYRRR